MKNPQTGLWTLATVVVCAVVGIAAYFLLISPQLDAASEAHAATEEANEFNELLDLQILQAQAKAKEVPTWLGEIAAIAKDMPPTAEQPDFHRLLIESIEAEDLPVVSVTYGVPTPIVGTNEAAGSPVEPAVDPSANPSLAPVPSPGASPEPDPSSTAAPTPTAEPGATDEQGQEEAFAGLVGLPFTITSEGSPRDVLRLLSFLQSQDERFVTVTGVDISRAQVTDAKPGRPELDQSDWTVSFTGLAFSLLSPESFPKEETGGNPPYAGGTFTNPFEPLPGTGQSDQ